MRLELGKHIKLSESASNLCTINPLQKNIVTSIYQWELTNHQKFSIENKRLVPRVLIYMCIYGKPFEFVKR